MYGVVRTNFGGMAWQSGLPPGYSVFFSTLLNHDPDQDLNCLLLNYFNEFLNGCGINQRTVDQILASIRITIRIQKFCLKIYLLQRFIWIAK